MGTLLKENIVPGVVSIGNNVFEKSIRQYDFPVELQTLVKENSWDLGDGKANTRHWVFVISRLVSTQIRCLELGYNMNEMILKSVGHIKFAQLRHLNLESNFITNLQGLCELRAYQLRQVNLRNNCLRSIKPLIKVGKDIWKDIRVIKIEGNSIHQSEVKSMVNRFYQRIRITSDYTDWGTPNQHAQTQLATNLWVDQQVTIMDNGLMMYNMCGDKRKKAQQESPVTNPPPAPRPNILLRIANSNIYVPIPARDRFFQMANLALQLHRQNRMHQIEHFQLQLADQDFY